MNDWLEKDEITYMEGIETQSSFTQKRRAEDEKTKFASYKMTMVNGKRVITLITF